MDRRTYLIEQRFMSDYLTPQTFEAKAISQGFSPVDEAKTVWVPKDGNPNVAPIVDIREWSNHKKAFAKSMQIYSNAKVLEGFPQIDILDINLFEKYYAQLAEDDSNRAELIAALWTESVSL